MESRVIVKGHPLHPMLIPFPFAFLMGAVVSDWIAWLFRYEDLWTTGGFLLAAGVCAGLLAAVPGVIDYLTVVPPRSSGKTRATKHLLCNASALVSLALAWLLREGSAADTHADADNPLATKLALAEEFNAIGDADGARSLAEEVLAEASGDLKSRAQRLLAEIG